MSDPRPEPSSRPEPPSRPELVEGPADPEDVKIITLARSALSRTGAAQGACLRDTDGRTYAGASVALAHLELSAVAVVAAMAVSSGAAGVEAVAVAGEGLRPDDLDIVRDLGGAARPVWLVEADGAVREQLTA